MEDTYIVKVTPQAQQQMREIAYHIALELKNPEAASNLLEVLERAVLSLENMPQRIPLTDEQPWRSEGIHKMVVGSYLVYFWIDEDIKQVYVIAVVYEKRDQRKQLARIFGWKNRKK